MVKPKQQSKKQQKKGIDFKKIKRKIGRKLPPPKNTTNTEVKSKAIILPEQSVASEKTGVTVSKKGLTLKELLQQTSHYNSKVRKDALNGIKDIFINNPVELKIHKLAVIEKLRERISDDDKLVRETLYQLFKGVIFPGFKEDTQELVVSLMMSYIFNAMTHLTSDVRLMAFGFLELILNFFPSSFSLYSEKILQSYEDLLRRNQFSLQDRSKLKSSLDGLVRCLSLLPCNKKEDESVKNEKENHTQVILHGFEREDPEDITGPFGIITKPRDLLPVLISCFHDVTPYSNSTPALDTHSFDCMLFILQSIEIIVKYFVKNKKNGEIENKNEIISPFILKKLWDSFPLNPLRNLSAKDEDRYFMLNAIITEIFLQMSDWSYFPPVLLERFLEFIEFSLTEKISKGRKFSKAVHEKYVLPLISFMPRLIERVPNYWKLRILEAFSNAFRNYKPESSMKLACLSAIQEMLDPEYLGFSEDSNDPEILNYQMNWVRDLPSLLVLLGDGHPLSSKAVLDLLLKLGQSAQSNSPLSLEYENIQHILKDFYCSNIDKTNIIYGPFIKLPKDIQEISICCLYYFSVLDPLLLQSLVSCCLCPDLDSSVIFRILEVVHSAYKDGHIYISDYLSFFITLISRFTVYPEEKEGTKSNNGTFKSITSIICSNLSQIGDNTLIFQILENLLVNQIMDRSSSLDNKCAFLRILVTLDSKPSKLSEESINKLSNIITEYLISVSACEVKKRKYLYQPIIILLHRNVKVLKVLLNKMSMFIDECGTAHEEVLNKIVSVMIYLNEDRGVHQVIVLCRKEMENILEKTFKIKCCEEINKKIEIRHKMQIVYDRMEDLIKSIFNGTLNM